MKVPGKFIQLTAIAPYDGMPPGIVGLTDTGRLYAAYDDKPPEEWTWTEINLVVEES